MTSRDFPSVQEVKTGRMVGYNGYNEVWITNRKRWEIVCIPGKNNSCREYVEKYTGKLKTLNFGFCQFTGEPIAIRLPDFIVD